MLPSSLKITALLPGLALLLACSRPGDISLELPLANATPGVVRIDTLTVRVSTVWHDSVVTSGTNFLLVGQYRDPHLGLITATGYAQLGWNGPYNPTADEIFDSLALELRPSPYRYGDTTQFQRLQVRRLLAPLVPGRTYYAGESAAVNPLLLNQENGAGAAFRAGPSRRGLHLRLADALGRELLQAGQQGRLANEAQLTAALPGLALAPGSADDAALLLLPLAGAQLRLYTHTPAVARTRNFGLSTSTAHFYQVTADRSRTLLASLSATNRALDATQTAREAYLAGALGLQIRLEIPYLANLRALAPHPVVAAAEATFETMPGTTGRGLPPPGTLCVFLSGRGGQRGPVPSGNGVAMPLNYLGGSLSRAGLETGRYQLPLAAYCQAIIDRQLPNHGLLLAAAVPQLPERVVLGGPGNTVVPLRVKIYVVR